MKTRGNSDDPYAIPGVADALGHGNCPKEFCECFLMYAAVQLLLRDRFVWNNSRTQLADEALEKRIGLRMMTWLTLSLNSSFRSIWHPVLDILSHTSWLSICMHNSLMQFECIYRPLSSNNFELPQLIKEIEEYVPSIHGELKLIATDFNAPETCWSTKSAPSQFFNSVRGAHARGLTQHVAKPQQRK